MPTADQRCACRDKPKARQRRSQGELPAMNKALREARSLRSTFAGASRGLLSEVTVGQKGVSSGGVWRGACVMLGGGLAKVGVIAVDETKLHANVSNRSNREYRADRAR